MIADALRRLRDEMRVQAHYAWAEEIDRVLATVREEAQEPLKCEHCRQMERAVTQMARENRSLEKRINQMSAAEGRAPEPPKESDHEEMVDREDSRTVRDRGASRGDLGSADSSIVNARVPHEPPAETLIRQILAEYPDELDKAACDRCEQCGSIVM